MIGGSKYFFRFGLIISLGLSLLGQQTNAESELAFLDFNLLNDIMQGIEDGLDNIFSSNPLEKLEDSKCLTKDLTDGISDLKRNGPLVMGTNCDDRINGNADDEIIYSFGGTDDVFAGAGDDIIYGGKDDNRLFGEEGDDIIISEVGTNLLDGGPGNDALFGGFGNDILTGGDGDDELIAGVRTTIMHGGNGSNEFYCESGGVVLDYNPDKGDLVGGQCTIANNIGFDYSGDTNIP